MIRPSRAIALLDGQRRRNSVNRSTRYEPAARPPQASFEQTFVRHYAKIREECRESCEPGLAIVAVHGRSGKLAAIARVDAKISTPTSMIVGRHAHADVYLPGDAQLSNRHLAVVVEPQLSPPHDGVRFRLYDLRSGCGFFDEDGRHVMSATADAPVMVSCGSYLIMLLITGDETDWPRVAGDAWSMIPRAGWAQSSLRRSSDFPLPPPWASGDSVSSLLREGEELVGRLRLALRDRQHEMEVGEAGLDRGILIGRHERCHPGGVGFLQDASISRVHTLVARVGANVYAFDVASTNGIRLLDPRPVAPASGLRRLSWRAVRSTELLDNSVVKLGSSAAILSWHEIRQDVRAAVARG